MGLLRIICVQIDTNRSRRACIILKTKTLNQVVNGQEELSKHTVIQCAFILTNINAVFNKVVRMAKLG